MGTGVWTVAQWASARRGSGNRSVDCGTMGKCQEGQWEQECGLWHNGQVPGGAVGTGVWTVVQWASLNTHQVPVAHCWPRRKGKLIAT